MAKRKIEQSKVKVGRGNLTEQSLQLVNGIIKAYFPRIGLYLVSLKGQAEARCYSLNYSGGTGFGTYAKGTYSPGESVFCIFNEAMGEGFIIGAHPGSHASMAYNIAYSLSGESTLGLNQSGTGRGGLLAGPLGGCTNESSVGIDIDSHCGFIDRTPGGSFSVSSETGICFFADPYSIGVQCDDATGMWVYSDDSYMRQSSINFQQIAGGKVEEDYNDNGELNETVGHSMFSWELLGQTEKPTEGDVIKSDGIAPGEPVGSAYSVSENAKPFHRVVEYGGYLGHGYQRVVNAPPVEKNDAYEYGTENKDQYCLSRIAQFADGDVSIESAKSIILAKHCYIPSIQTMQVADDLDGGAGDSSKESKGEYDFSHEDVNVKGAPKFNLGSTTNELLQELTALIDYQTYLLNYKLVYPFIYHKKDYYVSDAVETDLPASKYKDWFSKLRTQQFADMPEQFELNIHEKLKSTYYASESGLALLPEGGVSLYGGYGEELRMGAGTSTISSPGDIWIKAGRNIHLWAGNDIIMRAKNCIDESATDGSVRIKAEKHLEMLGGNAGTSGGVLIESKSEGIDFNFAKSGDAAQVSGLVIRASKGVAAFEGRDTYIRSGVGGFTSGRLLLDSGQGDISLRGNRVSNYIVSNYTIAGGTFDSSTNGNITSVIDIMPGNDIDSPGMLNMSLHVRNTGTLLNKDRIICGDNIVIKNNYMTLSEQKIIGQIDDKQAPEYDRKFDDIKKDLSSIVLNMNAFYHKISEDMYDDGKIGSDQCLMNAGFSYRTVDEYGAKDFKLYADRWQNMAYILDADAPEWEEKQVTTSEKKGQYPYPGDDFYTDGEKTCLVYQMSNLYNDDLTVLNPRYYATGAGITPEYEEPQYEEPILESINRYIIVGGENG